MARVPKDKPIGARITSEFKATIDNYLDGVEISLGELIRKSLQEYMWAHPLPNKPTEEVTEEKGDK